MKMIIPAPVIATIAEHLPYIESHASLDNLFMHADAPGDPPDGSKPVKVQAWLRKTNKETSDPLAVLGKLVEPYIELDEAQYPQVYDFNGSSKGHVDDPKIAFKKAVSISLNNAGLQYHPGGIVVSGKTGPAKTLGELIRARDLPSIETEFNRALKAVESTPREAVSAACNILESVFKIYIDDENLQVPAKQDLQGVWKVVREHLGFNAGALEDTDLKKIITGMLSAVDGIGALRTHASSAHGQGRKSYNLKPRHARLAINAAHTLVIFILETWDERKQQP
jgi:hypothetical protein